MILNLLLALAGMVIIFVIVVAARPADFRITRTATIATPPDVVFGLVNDFRRWKAWSPWEGLDPALQRIYEGASAGTGASYSWSGNSKAGEGRMTITESRPSDLIRIKLEFLKPFKATNTAEFNFKSEGNHTVVAGP